MYHIFQKTIKQQLFSTLIIIINVSRAASQHVRMISKRSCVTEDWSNAEKLCHQQGGVCNQTSSTFFRNISKTEMPVLGNLPSCGVLFQVQSKTHESVNQGLQGCLEIAGRCVRAWLQLKSVGGEISRSRNNQSCFQRVPFFYCPLLYLTVPCFLSP